MKVTLFGATGKTGRYLIAEGLKRGIELTIFARTSSLFEDSNVRVIRGEFTDKEALKDAIQGADAVLSALGPTTFKHAKNLPITRAMQAIISMMKQENVTRLIAVSTGTAVDPDDRFDWKIRFPAFLIRIMMATTYQDIIALAQTVRASELDWTLVRVAFLNNNPASSYLNVGLYGKTKHTMMLSREEVATFMFDQLLDGQFIKMAPGISTG
ncbi:NAD(P)-dependent oxidoreductase [Pectobacterium versatile]|uniref:NAD(P)-dependent oxidoreductase n=1 Tax=Pectobacterium versatile TaxID=2488639 RepID=UPI001CF56F27|nr:NAD(P)H-binding protein [Pectobacterium versatile]MCA6927739.1 NAD(P)H-binding protein [Pectobacterium versatile]MCH5084485.1 NAD(P)H-binding protein [Pectobacterium versatile]